MSIESEARKEHKEHPWTTMAQARQIAKDHRMKSRRRRNPCRANSNVPLRKKKATTVSAGADINVVRLYSTDVVAHYLRDPQHIVLSTGGWVTKTTIARMNQYAEQYGIPYHASIRGGVAHVTVQGKTYPFVDGKISIKL
jgi:hypothetical protein